jgi:hypothetical protein
MTGRFPVLDRAAAKMCSRFGVRLGEVHALETSDSAMRLMTSRRECLIGDLFNWHRPATIYQTGHKPSAKAVVDVHHGHV